MTNCTTILALLLMFNIQANAQRIEKVSHAEPLYYDLVRDLGARKGEKELNVGAEFINFEQFSKKQFLVEYEFAPIDRLGLEVETDFSMFTKQDASVETPNDGIESVKLSAQYSFFVSPRSKTTLAIGYTHVTEFASANDYTERSPLKGISYCPFFVAAKRWGSNFNTLVFAYPAIEQNFYTHSVNTSWLINASVHYYIPQTRHFIGVEFNHEFAQGAYELTIRPQVKIKLSNKVAIGIVSGLPVNKTNEGISSFFRFIYEP